MFLFFDRPVSGQSCVPLCIARCMKGGGCRDIAGALSPVQLVNDGPIVEGSFIPSGVESNIEGEARPAGWLLFSLPLVAGAVVCTQKWRGELKEGDWLKKNQRRESRRHFPMCGQRRRSEVGCANQSGLDASL